MAHDERRFWLGRKVAVTGATGFLGRHLLRHLSTAGAEVHALARTSARAAELHQLGVYAHAGDLADVPSLSRLQSGCDVTFHLAAAVDFHADLAELWRCNVQGALHVHEAARLAGVRRLVHCSSIAAIGATPTPLLQDESSPWNLGPLNLPYISTKREAECRLLRCARSGGPDIVVANPSCLIGPADPGPSEFGLLCQRFWKGRVPVHFGGGNNFVDVRDAALGLLLTAEHGRPGQRYFLGSENLTYTGFFGLLAKVCGKLSPRLRLPSWLAVGIAALERRLRPERKKPYLPMDQARAMGWYFFCSWDKARRELGYAPRRVERSLRDAYAWWRGQTTAA